MFIFSNLAMSLDGKIATSKRSFFPLGTKADLQQMQVLRRRCDAILMGASTLRVYKNPCLLEGASRQPVNILVSSQLKNILPTWKFFTHPSMRRILFVGSTTAKAKIKAFSKSSEVVLLKPNTAKNPIARQIVKNLAEKKIESLLVEGGGEIMWDFISQGLIDEYHVTLTPKIIGGKLAPTLVDGIGFQAADVPQLTLRQCRVVGEELYLTYSKKT